VCCNQNVRSSLVKEGRRLDGLLLGKEYPNNFYELPDSIICLCDPVASRGETFLPEEALQDWGSTVWCRNIKIRKLRNGGCFTIKLTA
jgi:hypothetical protein